MNRWVQIIILTGLITIAKAHHFIKLVILAGLGLAGLWMVHTLAQDYQNIGGGKSLLANIGSASSQQTHEGESEFKVFKRSINNQPPRINWEQVLSRDPASCARSFICQLAAHDENALTKEEKVMLELARDSSETGTWASKQLHEALKNAEQVNHPNQCMKLYKFCPYTSETMMTLLRVFGR